MLYRKQRRKLVGGGAEKQTPLGDAGQDISQNDPLPLERFFGEMLLQLAAHILLPMFRFAKVVLPKLFRLNLDLLAFLVQLDKDGDLGFEDIGIERLCNIVDGAGGVALE